MSISTKNHIIRYRLMPTTYLAIGSSSSSVEDLDENRATMSLVSLAHKRSALCSLSRCLTQSSLWSRGFASLPEPISDDQAPVNSKDGKVR